MGNFIKATFKKIENDDSKCYLHKYSLVLDLSNPFSAKDTIKHIQSGLILENKGMHAVY